MEHNYNAQLSEQDGFTCFWRIEKMYLCQLNVAFTFFSPEFIVNMLYNSKWQLVICHFKRYTFTGYFRYNNGNAVNRSINYSMRILTNIGWMSLVENKTITIKGEGRDFGYHCSFETIQQNFLVDDALTISVHLYDGNMKSKSAQCLLTSRMIDENHCVHLSKQNLKFFKLFKLLYPAAPVVTKIIQKNLLTKGTQTDPSNFDFLVNGKEDLLQIDLLNLYAPVATKIIEKNLLTTSTQTDPSNFDFLVNDKEDLLQIDLLNLTAPVVTKTTDPSVLTKSTQTDPSNFDFLVNDKEDLLQSDPLSSPIRIVTNITDPNLLTTSTQADTSNFLIDGPEDLLSFFRQTEFRYVTIRATNREFAIHKALLCASSPVFRAMFERDVAEKVSDIVDIDDVESETMTLLLRFLHREPIEFLEWDKAAKLYYVADKYQMKKLKDHCIAFLTNELSQKNVCEGIILADRHQDKVLKNVTQKYFEENSKSILHSKEWKAFFMSNTDLASKILCKFYTEQI